MRTLRERVAQMERELMRSAGQLSPIDDTFRDEIAAMLGDLSSKPVVEQPGPVSKEIQLFLDRLERIAKGVQQ